MVCHFSRSKNLMVLPFYFLNRHVFFASTSSTSSTDGLSFVLSFCLFLTNVTFQSITNRPRVASDTKAYNKKQTKQRKKISST